MAEAADHAASEDGLLRDRINGWLNTPKAQIAFQEGFLGVNGITQGFLSLDQFKKRESKASKSDPGQRQSFSQGGLSEGDAASEKLKWFPGVATTSNSAQWKIVQSNNTGSIVSKKVAQEQLNAAFPCAKEGHLWEMDESAFGSSCTRCGKHRPKAPALKNPRWEEQNPDPLLQCYYCSKQCENAEALEAHEVECD